MKIGLTMPFTAGTVRPAQYARIAEALGFDSLWIPEHPAYPGHTSTRFPGGTGTIPEVYSQMADQLVSLSMAAAVTTRLKLATGICLVAEHNPIRLAKQLSTLDLFSDGRLIFGIGGGWLREESAIFGVDFPRRWTQTAEMIAAMRKIWSQAETSFEGRYLKFGPIVSYPKPARRNGPPVVIGSRDPDALKRIAAWADGWCPLRLAPAELRAELQVLRAQCESNGREFNKLEISVVTSVPGDRRQVQETLRDYAEAGAHRLVVGWKTLAPDVYERELHRLASLYL